jgi:DtxR family Mn-dependent transcriptional regulator
VSHDLDLADQDVEEVAEELWTLAGHAGGRVADLLESSQAQLGALGRRGLVRVEGPMVTLTAEGRALAERQVRRHRLAEALFTTVLEVRDQQAVNRTACVIEHVLEAALTDSICAFLGHPKACPHGKPIPPGPCCRFLDTEVVPLVQPLHRLGIGRAGRIVYIAPREPARLVKLSNLGIAPGATVRLQQHSPAAVVRIGETTLALDTEMAGEIYVKPVADSGS